MRPAKYKQYSVERISAMAAEGCTIKEIAEANGVTTNNAWRIINRHKLAKPPILRVEPWCPTRHWRTYRELERKGYAAAERRAIVEQDIARERRA